MVAVVGVSLGVFVEHLSKLQYSQRTPGLVVKHQGALSPSGFLQKFLLRSLLEREREAFKTSMDPM